MRTNRARRILTTVGLCIVSSAVVGLFMWRAYAAPNVPRGIAYSGELLNNGAPDNAMHNFTFELSDGNVTACIDGPRNITLAAGRFDVGDLFSGNGCTLDTVLATKPSLFIRITVDGQVLSPMQPLGTVPFAARARVAESLDTPPVPTGAVSFFNLTVCPVGWTVVTAAQGRYLVGLPAGGTLGGTDGTPLGDKEDRPAGQHSHDITDPGHAHSYFAGNGGQGNMIGFTNQQLGGNSNGTTGSAKTGITVNNFGNVAGTNAPYLQLLVCQKD